MIRILFVFLAFLVGCTSKDAMTHFNGWAMTMPYRITIAKKLSKSERKKVCGVIYDTFKEVDTIYNNWNPNSEISKFNKNLSTQWIKLSDPLSKLLHQCNGYVELTDALFDPTVGTIIPKWRSSLQKHLILKDVNENVGWQYLYIKENAIQKLHPDCQLDLCAVSKGYAVDLLTSRLVTMGYNNLFVEWGGEVKCLGEHISKRDWRLQIITADKEPIPEKYQYISLKNQAIATSGKFMMYEWKADNENYTHIFNPKIKRPVKDSKYSLSSVSVIAPTCALADALATACMTFENIHEAKCWAEKIVKKNPEVTFYLLNPKQKNFMKIATKGTLFFDIGNVLLKFSHEKMIKQIAVLCGLDSNTVSDFLFSKGYHNDYELGKISSQKLFDELQFIATKNFNYHDLMTAASDIFQENIEMITLIDQLKKQGYTLVLLSNTNEAHFEFMVKNYPILSKFDHKILSYEVGLRKPDPQIFIKSLEYASGCPNFYTDDLEENIASAKKVGFDAVLFLDAQTLKQDLKKRHFLPQ